MVRKYYEYGPSPSLSLHFKYHFGFWINSKISLVSITIFQSSFKKKHFLKFVFEVFENVPQLNQQQRIAYGTLIEVVNIGSGEIYLLDAPGETGKTFLTSLLGENRSQNQVAATLL